MQAVRLKQPYKSNNTGEVCGFPAEEAQRLIAAGAAVPWPPAAPPAATEESAGARTGDGQPSAADLDATEAERAAAEATEKPRRRGAR
jgi:hypothetical protein